MTSAISQLTYAIGDIHGYDDLFERLIDRIRVDAEIMGARPRIVLLGDYIDRGPASRQVLERILRLEAATWCDAVVLMGNHEHVLLRFLEEPELGATWREWGGAATLASYGVAMPYMANDASIWRDIRDRFLAEMDRPHLDLLRRLPASFSDGDYIFVHAGVDPDRPLREQGPETFMYIRGRFLRAEQACYKVVVHGHTPQEPQIETPWRIGIDSGVYFSGVLSAVRLNGTERRLLQVRDSGT